MAEPLTATGLRTQLRDQLQTRIGQTRDLLNAYQQAYPDLLGQTPGVVQSTLAMQPVAGVNVHTDPQGLRPSYIAEQTIEPVEFGSFADPVSQLAFLAAPGLLRGIKTGLEVAGSPGPRFGALAGERGNLGPVPRSAAGEALPESTVRTEQGQLKRLYHGTGRTYPDFEMSQAGSGAGGDLYGPGIYLTDSSEVAGQYADLAMPRRETIVAGKPWAEVMQELGRRRISRASEDLTILPTVDATGSSQALDAAGKPLFTAEMMTQPPKNIRPVYADLKRPFDMNAPVPPETAQQLLRAVGHPIAGVETNLQQYTSQGLQGEQLYRVLARQAGGKAAANEALQQAGYDGITHIGGQVTGGQPHRVYIAFSPDTVYPAANVEGLP